MKQEPKVALINRKTATRFVIGLFLIAIFTFGYQYFRRIGVDLGEISTADTAGWVAAVEVLDEGQQAVLIKPDGEIVRSPGYRSGATDRELAWRPSGHHLFFVSDRQENVNHVYRWAIGRNDVERRTTGTLARSMPSFATGSDASNRYLLVVRQGMVFELDPKEGTESRLIPPAESQRGTAEEIADASGDNELRFRSARYTPDREWIVGVRRTDTGEALVLQSLTANSRGEMPALATIAAGSKIEFDINPQNGQVFFTAQNFQFPDPRMIPQEFVKNGRVSRPWEHWIGMVDPNNPQASVPPIAISPDKNLAFATPRVSPDGSVLLVTVGDYDESGLAPRQLIVMPARPDGGQGRTLVVEGPITSPSWAPDSQTIVFVRPDAQGKRSIFSIKRDGSAERNLTAGKGNFRDPVVSPQAGR